MVKDDLKLPAGDVLLRKRRGPDGTHPYFGWTKVGRLYTAEKPLAHRVCEGPDPEFEPVFEADRAAIEAASKGAAGEASGKN